jgi:hypothetical protein
VEIKEAGGILFATDVTSRYIKKTVRRGQIVANVIQLMSNFGSKRRQQLRLQELKPIFLFCMFFFN